jgi:hypothetical protein
MLYIHAYYKRMFQVFQVFRMYAVRISSKWYIFLQWLHTCFLGVLDVCCKCFNCFGRMLQVFYWDVAKVDLVLYILQWDPPTAATCYICWAHVYACGSGGGASGRRGKLSRRKSRRSNHVGVCRRGKRSGMAVKKAQQHAYANTRGRPDVRTLVWPIGVREIVSELGLWINLRMENSLRELAN